MIQARTLQWAVVPLWIAAAVVHQLVVPFPPWATRMAGTSLLVLFLTYAAGIILQTLSAVAALPLASRLHRAARAVFLLGGIAAFALDGRPSYLGSAWALFLLASRLSPTRPFGRDKRA